jgi:hypothetical protein
MTLEPTRMSADEADWERRYFVTYTGVDLPFNLVTEIAPEALTNRNTYFCGYYDKSGRLMAFEKFVYGDVELAHRYDYYDSGALRQVEILMSDEEAMVRLFDEQGAEIADQDAV